MSSMNKSGIVMPQQPESYWLASTEQRSFEKLTADLNVNIAVIGAGITGITTAYLLAKEGKEVALLEAGKILNGTTGYTTAKVTAQHHLIYDEFISHFGEENARLYFEANIDGLNFIRQMINEHSIECDWTEEDAYVYTAAEDKVQAIRDEYKAYEKLGIPGAYMESIPLPITARAAVVMKNQARFHPIPYLLRLLDEFIRLGGRVYEQTTVEKVEEGMPNIITTSEGHRLECLDVVSCSHFPVFEGGMYYAKMHADSSYALAVKSDTEYPGGMYISAENPKKSIRAVEYEGEKLLLIGGESHKTGQGICTINHYEALKTFAEQNFAAREIAYRWSTNDYGTLDKLPYIGMNSLKTPNSFIATGYRKWGMTTGTVAAMILRDMIIGQTNRYEKLFDPNRFHADPSVQKFVKENVNVAKQYVAGKLEWIRTKTEDLGIDEAAHVRIKGKKAGAYRDRNGKLYLVDTTCTHMGCEVAWNAGDRTWDCPCHGSRFHYDGSVIEGPAAQPLKEVWQHG